MLFNSIDFAIFLPIVFLLYWYVFNKNVRLQNLFFLFASYFFYAWWDWRYLSLILICSLTNYGAGRLMMKYDDEKIRKIVLISCCVVCLGILGVFKYYNFFITSFIEAFSLLGVQLQAHTLRLILPIGISFYTFHTLSYTIDVYRRKFEPTKDVVSFFLFVSIFPLAMAGPIERATNLLPQIFKPRVFDDRKVVDGMRQILWGLFKKMVIADSCAIIVNDIFANYESASGSRLLIGAVFFTFQIYGDFSGYSDMAIGIGRLFGFNFMRNFNFPYFSRDIAEFWRRWHISLTTWFRDYVYIPLGGSRVSKAKVVRNTFIIFLISGFWHGANWTYIVWGAYHALLFLPLILAGKNRKYTDTVAEGKLLPTVKELFQMGITFLLVVVGWIIFRAENIYVAGGYFGGMLHWETVRGVYEIFAYKEIWFCFAMLILEWIGRKNQFALEKLGLNWKPIFRYAMYYIIVIAILLYVGKEQVFIYFQF